MELTGRDVHAFVRAMQPAIGGKIQKVYGTDRFALVLDLYARDLPYRYLYIELASMIFMHSVKVAMPERPAGFAQRVRGQLQGMRIAAIEQYAHDRIIAIRLEGKRAMTLIIELFAKGNLIVLDENEVIRNVIVKESYGSRDVRPGTAYRFPPTSTLDFSALEETIDPDKHLVAQIAAAGLGGRSAESILARFVGDVATARIGDLTDRKGLSAALTAEWDAERFSIERSSLIADPNGQTILEVLANAVDLEPAPSIEIAPVRAKSERAIDIQSTRADELTERRAEDLKRGELLFEHYALIEEMLSFARTYRQEHGSLKGLSDVWPERFVPLVSASGVTISIDVERFI